ncbi:MAG: ABC transporter substrate-binding protein [Chloroflexi bacterium]|nr:ABC transporter substrate-binding protein [Chloroflexota bacterium]
MRGAKGRMLTLFLGAAALLLLAAQACAGAEPTATPTPTPTPRPAATATPTPTLAPGAPTPTIRVVLVATPTPTPTTPPVAAKPSGTLKYAMDTISSALPLEHFTGDSAVRIYMGGTVFEWLLHTDMEGKIVPGLATKWETKDGTYWDLTIRKGVTFPSGREMTAKDVAGSIMAWKEHGKGSFGNHMRRVIDRAEVLDPNTVRMFLKDPDFLWFFTISRANYRNPWTIDMEYLDQVGIDKFREQPVGTGPFRVVEKVAGDHVTLRVRDDVAKSGHWRVNPVYWEQIQAYKVQEESTRIAMLKTAKLDLIDIAVGLKDQVAGLPQVRNEGVSGAAIGLCCISDKEDSIFNDIRVRKALNLAVDMDTVAKTVFKGELTPQAVFIFTKDMWGFDPSLTPYPYNVEEAKKLAKEAGFPPPGYKMTMYLRTDAPGFPDLPAAGEAIGTYWKRNLGVDVQFQPIEYARLSAMFAWDSTTRKMQAPGLWNNTWTPRATTIPNPSEVFNTAFGCKDIFGASHTSRLTCGEVDNWMLQYPQSPDPAVRDELARKVQKWYHEQWIPVPIGVTNQIFVSGPKVATYSPQPGFSYGDNFEYVVPKR